MEKVKKAENFMESKKIIKFTTNNKIIKPLFSLEGNFIVY